MADPTKGPHHAEPNRAGEWLDIWATDEDGYPQRLGCAFNEVAGQVEGEAEANATLWAAAPEIAEALEWALDTLDINDRLIREGFGVECDQRIDQAAKAKARATLVKATTEPDHG